MVNIHIFLSIFYVTTLKNEVLKKREYLFLFVCFSSRSGICLSNLENQFLPSQGSKTI